MEDLMSTFRLVPEAEWERALGALESAVAALRRCGSMTLPEMGPETPAARGPRRMVAVSKTSQPQRAGGVSGIERAREVIDRVDAGGARHVPQRFVRSGPTISDFVDVLANGGPFRVPDLVDPLRKYVELKDTRRIAAGQIRAAVANNGRFRRLDDGSFERSANEQ